MKPSLDLVVALPLGPNTPIDFVLDTLASITCYIRRSRYKIIIADDTENPMYQREIKHHFPDVIFITNPRSLGLALGLYTSLCNAYCYALDHFDFPVLLRLDTDALIIGPDPELPIIEFFKNNPNVALAGVHVDRLHSSDDFGNPWINYGRAQYVAIAKLFTKFFLKHPFIYGRIRKILFKALYQEYDLGELVFGGANAWSRSGLEKLREHGLLPLKNVIGADLEEDHFFTMLVGYVGMRFGDLSSGDLPFALVWRGLPASPETLHKANKKIIHSTRFWKDMKEAEIRKYFRDIRERAMVSNFVYKDSFN